MSSCTDSTENIVQVVMITIVIFCSIFGNGIICLLLLRFKTLRTVPNILIVNLAAIDVINALMNMPLMISWYICKVTYLKGKWISWFTVSSYVLFMYLTVFSLVVLMMDRYGAICHGLKYHTWKTRNKAYIAAAVIWLSAGLYTYGMFSLGLDIDVGDLPVMEYRKYYFKRFGRSFIIPGYLVPFGFILVLAFMMCRSVRISTAMILSHCNCALQKRVRSDVMTAKTIGITVAAYFFMGCFPMLLHNVARIHGSWLHFLAFFFVHMNSMANPVIYSLRTRRFRQAFWLLTKEPCGRSQPMDLRKNKIIRSSLTYKGLSTVQRSTNIIDATSTFPTSKKQTQPCQYI